MIRKGTMIEVLIPPELEEAVSAGRLRRAARTAVEMEGASTESSLSVVVTGDDAIQALNRQFRGIDAPTDVLSFGDGPVGGPFVRAPGEPPHLGDVILSLPRVREQAEAQGHSVEEELQLLVVHGVLHLLGYDHETSEDEARMWARQDAILCALGGNENG